MAIVRSLAVAALILNLSACGSAQKTPPGGDNQALVGDSEAAPAALADNPKASNDEFDAVAACDPAADHILVIMKTDIDKMLAGMEPEQAEKARAEIAAQLTKESLVAECKRKQFTEAQFNCIMGGASMEDFMKCETADDEVEKDPAPSANAARCEPAVDHVMPLLMAEDKELAAQSADQIAALRTELVKECGKQGFTNAQFDCIMGAADLRGVSACEHVADEAGPAPAKAIE